MNKPRKAPSGFKRKELLMIPARVAIALQEQGWYLRSRIIWAKGLSGVACKYGWAGNPMPESVRDRPTSSYEEILMLSKSERYWSDFKAIQEPGIAFNEHDRTGPGQNAPGQTPQKGNRKTLPDTQSRLGDKRDKQRGHSRRHDGFNDRWDQMERDEQCSGMRNIRNVWTFSPAQFAEDHFATFPEQLPRLCILAGCPFGGTVLDPFMGAATTALVAAQLGRNFLGIELSEKNVEMGNRRIASEINQHKLF